MFVTKLRIYDKKSERMFYPYKNRPLEARWDPLEGTAMVQHIEAMDGKGGKWSCSDNMEDLVQMQYLGLLDKNQKELCEYDIVHSYTTGQDYITVFDMIFGLRFYDEKGFYVMPIEPVRRPQNNLEIVGNLFENRDMVEKSWEKYQ